jgi:ATP/maltotriose-dependent transcriptional regulator MalT
LGWADEAEQAARTSLALVGSSFVRNQAFSTIHLGNAHFAAGNVDEAAQVIGDGAVLAARNRSARVLDTLSRARASLRTWQDRPAVRELDDKLRAYRLLPSSTT